MFITGQIVYSKSGRDRGKSFIVVGSEKIGEIEYAFLVDGAVRKLEKPKKKKEKHIQMTKLIDEEIKSKIDNSLYLNDADIRKSLKNHIFNRQ